MKILITGANGFIGSYLADFFLKKNYHVIATSRRFHGSTKKLLANATLIEMDVLDAEQLNNYSCNVDIIVHTATANDKISKNTLKGVELSAIGTKNILDFAEKNKIPKCIVFSTFQVYGTDLLGEIDEDSCLNYQNDYGLNHLFAEMYAQLYARQGKVQCVSVRPTNVYGRIITDAFDRWNLVPACFCKEAIEFGSITLQSSGNQMRNFVSLGNLSKAVESIIQNFPKNYECFNLASSQTYTIIDIAKKVKATYEAKFEKKLQLNILGSTPQKTNYFSVNLKKIQSLGFTEDNTYTPDTEIEQIFNYLNAK